MRVIAGIFKGRRLNSADIVEVRPTSDKVREAVFDILAERVHNADVLDLFAGFGMMGLEAVSRGARSIVSVDKSRTAVRVIQENTDLLKLSNVQIYGMDVFRFLIYASRKKQLYDLIFADPPYEMFEKKWIHDLWKGVLHLMKEKTIFILEHPARWLSTDKMGPLDRINHKKYGQTCISLYQKAKNDIQKDLNMG